MWGTVRGHGALSGTAVCFLKMLVLNMRLCWPVAGRPIPSFLRSDRGTLLHSRGPTLSARHGASVSRPWLAASLLSHSMAEGFILQKGKLAQTIGGRERIRAKPHSTPSYHKLGLSSYLGVRPCRNMGSIGLASPSLSTTRGALFPLDNFQVPGA